MARLIRLDRSGHTTLAEWRSGDRATAEQAMAAFRRELDAGMVASVQRDEHGAEVVRELPLDADLVVMRRPIAGG
jgi:sugar/nucleoside kinase (ribokinase family)